MSFDPIVKWSGSKRSQAAEIVARMPRVIATYYEPFCGGCSVLYRLLNTPSIKVGRYIVSDINKDLIGLWTMIKYCPEELCDGYSRMWKEFNEDPYREERLYQRSTSERYADRKKYFEKVRARYNEHHSPIDFLFIMRTTTNGMPRYNDMGQFNNSCHFSRPGIHPNRLKKICLEWSRLLNEKNVVFICRSFEEVSDNEGDLTYIDAPYFSVKRNQMYFGGIDFSLLEKWIRTLKGKWIMSYDGKRGNVDYTVDIPQDLFVCHEYLKSGKSSFERYLGLGRCEEVYESLYSNYTTEAKNNLTFIQPTLF